MARIPAAQRRNDFIHAAVEVIAAHGIDGATTRKIAEQANANLAMLHYCYDSKEALFSDVFAYAATTYSDVIRKSDAHSTLAETAREILRGVMQYYVDSPSFAAASFELISWARRQHEDRGIAVFDEAVASVRRALTDASASNPVQPETIDEIAYVIGTLSDGFGVNWLTYGDRAAAEAQIDVTTTVFDTWLATRLAPLPAAS
ncbi:TetR/AcrR family transcriptional regulator [Nocardioides jejuensis]|uniref:TetR/AcrR family transcriptional regulator n=1 Tax=Nocardioides jejuensis TaxID=2502782 RepID=A0A4R1CJP5_9ACTN|nr:TetR/AcrR family transcriptional regulator [Nocardioides jejuensis]TCJ31097.1 TetR/AcrR family transcriptional regulator [Nocardioides jejuensis]